MNTQPPGFLSTVLRLTFSCVLMFVGLHYLQNFDPLIKWSSYVLVILMGLAVIKQTFQLLGLSVHTAIQVDLDTYSKIPSGNFGQARFANTNDAFIKIMAKGKGLFLGVIDGVMLFFDPFASGNGHMVTYAPARTGKTISVVIPALMYWFGGSLFVTDVKGELAAITMKFRQLMGQTVLLFDPFNVLGTGGLRFNPLSILLIDIRENNGKNLHDLALLIGLLLIPRKEEKNEFFRNGGRRFVIALLLYLAVFDKKNCHLPGLRDLVWASNEEKIKIAELMQCTDAYGGLLKNYGNHLYELLNPSYIKTFGAMRDYAIDSTQIYDGHTNFGKSLMTSDFDPRDLLNRKTTLYNIIPEDKLESHGVVIGFIAALYFELIAMQKDSAPILFLMEEMGNLGSIPNLSKALSLLPSKGLRLWMIFQSRRQPVEIYGKNIAGLIDEQSSMHQQWNIRDLDDQKHWCERIGQSTQKTYNLNHDPLDPLTPWKPSVGERSSPVMSADETGRMNNDLQLIWISGNPVIVAKRAAYYEVEPWRSRAQKNPYHPDGYPKDKPVRYWLDDLL